MNDLLNAILALLSPNKEEGAGLKPQNIVNSLEKFLEGLLAIASEKLDLGE